jgi:glucosyl-dolichyl phosphate glucuronosyltransferase
LKDITISVVICTYSEARWEDLECAVESVKKQTLQPRDVIIVVDHNPEMLGRVRGQFDGIVAVGNSELPGLSGARNTGIAMSKGELVAFLDDDAVAAPDWLAHLVSGYTSPNVLGVGGAINPTWEQQKPGWFPEEFNWVVGCNFRGMPQSASGVRNLIGCNMSFRRQVFEQVGGFRTGFGQVGAGWLRCDETEFCMRLRQQRPQGTLIYEPSAKVQHRVPGQRSRAGYFCTRCFTEGLAKAALAKLRGSRDGLSSELTFIITALPRGILLGFGDVIRKRDLSGLARAGTIVLGLTLTTAGYLFGTARIFLTTLVASHVKTSTGQRDSTPISPS